MAVPAEVQNFVNEMLKAGLAPEDFASILSKAEANAAVANALKSGVMAQSDYSRNMQTLKADQKKAQDKAERSTAYVAQLSKWKSEEVDPVVQRANESYTEYQRRLSALQGVEPTMQPPPQVEMKRDPETGKFITAEDFQKQAQEFGRNMPLVSGVLDDIREQYRELYTGVADAPKFSSKALIQHSYEKGMKLEDAAEDLYKFGDRQSAIHQADVQRRIDEGIKDGVSKRLSEMAVTGPSHAVRAPGHRVPALDVGARPAAPVAAPTEGQPAYSQAADTPARHHDRVSRFADKLSTELYGGGA